jgi:hypothetical protein
MTEGFEKQRHLLGAIAISFLACLAGCTTIDRTHSDAEPREVRIARQYIKETTGREKIEVGPVTKFDGYTAVWIWYLPASPGDFEIINVGEDGRVIEVMRGMR